MRTHEKDLEMLHPSGHESAFFEQAMAELPPGHRATARIVADFLLVAGNEPYAEPSATKKYNFKTCSGGTTWLAIHGTKQCLAIEVRDYQRLLTDTEWYRVPPDSGDQFQKGGWRRLWLTIDDPTATQIDDLKRLLTRLQNR